MPQKSQKSPTRRILAGNWKMNPSSSDEAKALARASARNVPSDVSIILFPPSIFFSSVAASVLRKKNVSFGLQNIFSEEKGAYTGEISAGMAASSGATAVLLGHSERRFLGEDNALIGRKTKTAVLAGLTPVLCFGEKERDEHGGHFIEIRNQIESGVSLLSPRDMEKVVFAYEPVWAIGKSASSSVSPHDLHEVVLFVKKILHEKWKIPVKDIRLLYGGAVEETNAAELLSFGDIDGFLVGHKSLDPKAFHAILASLSRKMKKK